MMKCLGILFLSCGLFLPLVSSQVFTSRYFFPTAETVSLDGSSATGHCSNVTTGVGDGSLSRCDAPTSSVLFDGIIPTLTGLDGDMWASQLLTLTQTGSPVDTTFDFTTTPGYVRVQRIEVVMFNCPERGIAVQTIIARDATTLSSTRGLVGTVNVVDDTSCDSLVRVCIPVSTTRPVIDLQFFHSVGANFYLAEVTFYFATSASCTPDPITTAPGPITTAPSPITTAPSPITSGPGTEPGSIITIPATASQAPASTTSGSSDSSSPGFASNSSSTTPTNTTSSLGGIIAAVIIVCIIAAIAIVVVIILIIYFRRKQRKQEKASLIALQDGNRNGLGANTLEKKSNDTEMNANPGTNNSGFTGAQGSAYEDMHDPGDVPGTSTYEAVDNIPGVQDSAADDQVYNVLREDLNTQTLDDETQQTYSQIADRSQSVSEANNPMYSVIGDPGRGRRGTSPSELYAQVKKKPKRPQPPKAFQSSPEAEYAVVDKKSPPKVPKKLPELVNYLETDFSQAEHRVSGEGATIATLTHSVVSSEAMNENPVYATADQGVNPEDEDQENVYAEPGLAVVPEPNPSSNIYEQIYSDNTLSPSSFNEGSRVSEVESSEDLYHYSSIYTVPVLPAGYKPLEMTAEHITEVRSLGSGNFGAVVLAKTVGLSCKDLRIGESTDASVMVLVAVKKLKTDANISTQNLFEKEYMFMSRLDDPNVVRLLGVCKTGTPFIMMEYMENGDLNQFLWGRNKVVTRDPPGPNEITLQKLIKVCAQIASGMKYLASKNFVHRDLATRNCLVNDDFDVKIADFGMSRNLYDSHYYVIKGHAVLPIRWMASECFYGQFSAKTDVWAFGATMWEVFELAKHEPYYELEDKELVRDACKGEDRTILSCPGACPDEVYQIMLQCWHHNANERATFEELQELLSSLLE